jgi:YD repeat-containing protein
MPLNPRRITHKGEQIRTLAMPGAETLAPGACSLKEVDLSMPVSTGSPVQLVRSYHSFFEPSGPWGKGWALDLPRLEEVNLPIRREGSELRYRKAYELITPLNSVHARFAEIQKVPALHGAEVMAPGKECAFWGVSETKTDFLSSPTRVVLLKDGGIWHFSKGGLLVAVEDGPSRTVYERDETGKVTRIVGLAGKHKEAEIELRYGPGGRLIAAEGKNSAGNKMIRYEYDEAGRLTSVASNAGRMGYMYHGPWVSKITWVGAGENGTYGREEVLRSFDYNAMGQLVGETYDGTRRIQYETAQDPQGSTVITTDAAKPDHKDVMRYDAAMRPTEATYGDGTHAVWSYPPQGGTELEIAAPTGNEVHISESPDHRKRTVKPSDGPQTEASFDEAGRMVSLSANGRNILEQHWDSDGRLERVQNETSAAWQEYDEDGLVSRVILAPRSEQGQFKHFRTTRFDRAHRPVEVKDHTGLHLAFQYTDSGEIASLINRRDGKDYGVSIDRNRDGRVRGVKSSWGAEDYAYDSAGELKNLKVEKMGKTAAIQFQSGLPQRFQQFDGGVMNISYHGEGTLSGLPERLTCPDGQVMSYHYAPSARLSQVNVGQRSRVLLDYDLKGRLVGFTWGSSD